MRKAMFRARSSLAARIGRCMNKLCVIRGRPAAREARPSGLIATRAENELHPDPPNQQQQQDADRRRRTQDDIAAPSQHTSEDSLVFEALSIDIWNGVFPPEDEKTGHTELCGELSSPYMVQATQQLCLQAEKEEEKTEAVQGSSVDKDAAEGSSSNGAFPMDDEKVGLCGMLSLLKDMEDAQPVCLQAKEKEESDVMNEGALLEEDEKTELSGVLTSPNYSEDVQQGKGNGEEMETAGILEEEDEPVSDANGASGVYSLVRMLRWFLKICYFPFHLPHCRHFFLPPYTEQVE